MSAVRRRLTALLAAVGLVLVLATAQGTGTTEASWVDREVASGMFTAGVLGAPVPNGCVYSDRTFTPSWNPPAEPSVAPTGYEYQVIFNGALTGPRVVQDWTLLDADARQFTHTHQPAVVQLGSYSYSVRAVSGTWQSSASGTAPVVQLLLLIGIGGCSWS